MIGKLLVVDDDHSSCQLVKAIFRRDEQLEIVVASDGRSGLEKALTERPDVVLLDLGLPDLGGLEVLEQFMSQSASLPVIILTASDDVRSAVRATQLGAFNYLTKPIDHQELALTVRRALETRALRMEVDQLRQHVRQDMRHDLALQMGDSRQVRQVVEQVGTVARSTFTVLILGETGTGKELVAQAIHRASDRRNKPIIALDCGAIPEQLLESELFGHERGAFTGADRRKQGRLRLAEGGTCFLDEVGNLPLGLQAKLLRVLESREIQAVGAERASPADVRFIAATNHDLQVRVTQGLFRADLYFRLAQYTIALPPLRERREDVAPLTRRFVAEASLELRRPIQAIAPEALELLARYEWPGNVRELRNVVRQVVLETTELAIRPQAIEAVLGKPAASEAPALPVVLGGQSLKEIAERASRAAERQAIAETLKATGGNKSRAARLLKTDYKTLHVKMRTLGLRSRDSIA